MLAVSWFSLWRLRQAGWACHDGQRRTVPTWLWRVISAMTFSGWVATVAGWYVTEIGRQPFLVYGQLRTADLVTQTPAATIGWSLAGYLVLYVGLLVAYIGVLRYLSGKALDTRTDADPVQPYPQPDAGPGPAAIKGA
jgi:cytochrome d ubiquinol oxidase subunit I